MSIIPTPWKVLPQPLLLWEMWHESRLRPSLWEYRTTYRKERERLGDIFSQNRVPPDASQRKIPHNQTSMLKLMTSITQTSTGRTKMVGGGIHTGARCHRWTLPITGRPSFNTPETSTPRSFPQPTSSRFYGHCGPYMYNDMPFPCCRRVCRIQMRNLRICLVSGI